MTITSTARAGLVLASIVVLGPACAPRWNSGLLANPRQVALALNDPAEIPAERFDPRKVPVFEAPKRLRPCCAFGQDLEVKVGPVPIPFYEQSNVLSPNELGQHGYDKGDLTDESNGLVYTCRGGFIDIAHVRDNADRTIFLALKLARALPNGATIEFPDEGTIRRVIVKPLPEGLLARHGRWKIATALASWANYELSNWHEIITWYGFESIKGMSERLSSFSPEDLYSNALGINLAAGIITNREMGSREQYEQSMDAWLGEALRRLGAVPKAQARLAMKAVDGLWWDSSKRVPDWKLVTRRHLAMASPVAPWIVADAVPDGPATPALEQMCKDQPAPLPLVIRDQLGDLKIADIAAVQFEFTNWIPEQFPMPVTRGSTVTQADFPAIVEQIQREGAKDLGPQFDQPRDKTD